MQHEACAPQTLDSWHGSKSSDETSPVTLRLLGSEEADRSQDVSSEFSCREEMMVARMVVGGRTARGRGEISITRNHMQ